MEALTPSVERVGGVRQVVFFLRQVKPVDVGLGVMMLTIDEPAVAAPEALDKGGPWREFGEKRLGGEVNARLDHLRADDDLARLVLVFLDFSKHALPVIGPKLGVQQQHISIALEESLEFREKFAGPFDSIDDHKI